jgi:hypothetical protein
MNERIKELVEKSYIYDKQNDSSFFYKEKFAEFIVKECLAQADNIREGCEVDGEAEQALGADWVGLAIARHFGVKE